MEGGKSRIGEEYRSKSTILHERNDPFVFSKLYGLVMASKKSIDHTSYTTDNDLILSFEGRWGSAFTPMIKRNWKPPLLRTRRWQRRGGPWELDGSMELELLVL